MRSLILFLSILVGPAACTMAQVTSSEIRQYDQAGNWSSITVGPLGSGTVSSYAVTPPTTTFELWSTYNAGSTIMLGEATLGVYTPVGNVTVVSQDTNNTSRTRADMPYTVNYTVSGMESVGSSSNQGDMYEGLYVNWFDQNGNPLTPTSGAGPTLASNGSFSLQTTPVTPWGTEVWATDSLSIPGMSGAVLSTATMTVYPIASASETNFPIGTYNGDPTGIPTVTVSLTDLYPDNQTELQLIGPNGTSVIGSQTVSTSGPNSRTITFSVGDYATAAGTYTLQVWTYTPFNGGRWDQVPFVQGTVQFTLVLSMDVHVNQVSQ